MDTAEQALPGPCPVAGALYVELSHTLMPLSLVLQFCPQPVADMTSWLGADSRAGLQASQGQDDRQAEGHRICGVPEASWRCCRMQACCRQVHTGSLVAAGNVLLGARAGWSLLIVDMLKDDSSLEAANNSRRKQLLATCCQRWCNGAQKVRASTRGLWYS